MGAEAAIARNWTAKIEYLYRDFGRAGVLFPSGTSAASAFDAHSFRVGLNYKLGAAGESDQLQRPDSQTEFRQLGDPRPDDLHPAGLSGFPVAVSRREQLHAVGADAATPGPPAPFSACGCGTAASSITIRSCCRASVCTTRRARPASRTAKPRSRILLIRATTPRACFCARRSGLAASRKMVESTYGQMAQQEGRVATHRPGRKIRRP